MLIVHKCTCVLENILSKVLVNNGYNYFVKIESNIYILYSLSNDEIIPLNSSRELTRLMTENFTKEQILQLTYKGKPIFVDNNRYVYSNNYGGIEISCYDNKKGENNEFAISLYDDGEISVYFSKEEMMRFVEVIKIMVKQFSRHGEKRHDYY